MRTLVVDQKGTGRKTLIIVVIAAFLFWMLGGLHWLEKIFPPRRPKFMPANSVWIDAPALPISWHHGWWFGCSLSSSELTDYCRLVRADGELIYGGEYLPCNSRSPISEAGIHLVSPDSANMWLFREKSDGVVGFLADGDLLLPVEVIGQCVQVKSRRSAR